ncbi:MAG: group II intron maturase-specific domain-containing protein [Haloechinothrix sp.]
MSGDVHVRFCESRGVRFPPATHRVVMVAGNRADAERLRDEAATVFLPMGLRLSEEKTTITHIDEGLDFLGMRIQRHKKRGADKRYVYTYPTRASLASVKAKVKATASRRATNQSLDILIRRLNPVLRGWTNYHRHGAASKTFAYLGAYLWRRVWIWLRTKHPKATVRDLQRLYLNRCGPSMTASCCSTRRWWRSLAITIEEQPSQRRGRRRQGRPCSPAARDDGEPDAVKAARPVRRAGQGNGPNRKNGTAPWPDSTTGSWRRRCRRCG